MIQKNKLYYPTDFCKELFSKLYKDEICSEFTGTLVCVFILRDLKEHNTVNFILFANSLEETPYPTKYAYSIKKEDVLKCFKTNQSIRNWRRAV